MGCLEDCEAVQCGWGGSDWRKAGADGASSILANVYFVQLAMQGH